MNLYLIQERVKQGKQCPYCLKEPEYINSTEVYGKDYGMMYICKPCQAWFESDERMERIRIIINAIKLVEEEIQKNDKAN